MLVLTRKKGQSIIIGDNVEVTIIEVNGDQIRVGIKAPNEVSIYRKEVYLEIEEENKKAAGTKVKNLEGILKDINK